VTDAGLAHLKALPHLKRLKHEGTRITAAGLGQFAHLDRTPTTTVDVAERPKALEPSRDPGGVVKPDAIDVTPDRIRAALTRALPTLQKSLAVYAEKRDCFSCHHQAVSLVALEIARSRGLAIDEDTFQAAVALTLADLESAREPYRKGRGQPGGVTRAAYALWTLEAGGHPADETTAAVAEYLLKADRDRDHWTTSSRRPPIEASLFTTTALAIRGLTYYGSKGQTDAAKDRVRRARAWLTKGKPADTEDRVFRLWGLKYADATPGELEAAAKDLLAAQRDDGGWAQADKLASDAYATGSAMVALHQAGGLKTDHASYRRGAAFLLRTQKDDGTWFVASRSHPFQPYFESGFPYGKDQFIAVAASGWAAAALALALPAGP
jgi:squalene cyclase